MGQAQSATGKDGIRADVEEVERRVDYYELLGVERDASEEDLKKAYRRKALELHPDRNFGNAEAATKLFADVQAAYEVLSDPQERAWYDSHRDAFLGTGEWSGKDQNPYNTDLTTTADIMKLFSKFNPRMEFTDSSTGFFGALRDIFEKLADEETRASQWENIDPMEWPTFGKREDDFDLVVRPFYAAWSNFSTRKSFSWLDQYRYSDASDRRVRRLMEKENRRLREEGIREYNDAVRSLVAFVKKRDPRYQANAQNETQRQEALRKITAAQAMKSRAANSARLRQHVIPDWARSEEPEYESSASSENEQQQFECVVCRKSFKSQQQFEAHERSKKHAKAVKQLCWEMRMQDEQLRAGDESAGIHQSEIDGPPSEVPLIKPTRVPYGSVEDFGSLDSHTENPGVDILPHACEGRRPTSSEGDSRRLSDRVECGGAASEDGSSDELEGNSIDFISQELESSNLDQVVPQKIGKAKLKRSKKATAVSSQSSSNLRCASCNAAFPSRTKLFDHIRDLRHAAPQKQTAESGRKASKKKR